ncbi:hypothetical protein REPUB_Repub16aG0043800 [Reevesia pubescens]
MKVGSLLGVDSHTLAGEKGRYVRLCVQVKLDKPLSKTTMVDGRKHSIVYEGICLLCFNCGKIGHNKESCHDLANIIPS